VLAGVGANHLSRAQDPAAEEGRGPNQAHEVAKRLQLWPRAVARLPYEFKAGPFPVAVE